ncbi:MAG: molybdenum cofactor guanylyltransferase [Pirellulales bacterium]
MNDGRLGRGGLILCGGRSSRMGRDKALLPFGPDEVLLQRVARLLSEAVPHEQIVCVAASGRQLPPLPAGVQTVADPIPDGGPLVALAAGLATIADRAEAIFVTGCDAPFLSPRLVARMFDLLQDASAAAPHDGERWHPLAGVYRTAILPAAKSLLESGERSVVALLEKCSARRVAADEIRDSDPQLQSLITCNTPGDYRDALQRADL